MAKAQSISPVHRKSASRISFPGEVTKEIPFPAPFPPGFVTPPSDFLEFVMLYVLFVEIVLLALPRKVGNRILETLFPILRRYL